MFICITTACVAAQLLALEPNAPWKDTYESTAAAIVRAAHESPLFAGPTGVAKTIEVIVATAHFESAGNPRAEGDHLCRPGEVRPKCTGEAQSLCLLQVGRSNLKGLGTTAQEILNDVDVCVDKGLRLMHVSFAICRARPLEDRLANYAAGGSGCGGPKGEGILKSRHRMLKATRLFEGAETMWRRRERELYAALDLDPTTGLVLSR